LLSWRKCATFVSQILTPIWRQRTSFLFKVVTFVSSKYHLTTRAWHPLPIQLFRLSYSPLTHHFPSFFASNNYFQWKALLNAFLLKPTQLPTTLKLMFNDVETIVASITFWAIFVCSYTNSKAIANILTF
jgi:hypothetical protein